jgi:hypothetical protein
MTPEIGKSMQKMLLHAFRRCYIVVQRPHLQTFARMQRIALALAVTPCMSRNC